MLDQLIPRHRRLKLWINTYLPLLGASVRVSRISPDFREIDVQMPLNRRNRNLVGTHFGGSLYSMTDPFFMLMLMENLGKDYIVWDKAARIDFIAPGRGTVQALFRLDDTEIERVRCEAESGKATLPVYTVEVRDDAGELVARVEKTLYVRKKRPAQAS